MSGILGIDPPIRGRRIVRAIVALGLALAASLTLASCSVAPPIGVLREDGRALILLGYQCTQRGFVADLKVGRAHGRTMEPAIWSIKAVQPGHLSELRPGTVPGGYMLTHDGLHGVDIGLRLWFELNTVGGHDYAADFDIRKIKDGHVLDSSGRQVSRSEFDRRYPCEG